MPRLLAELPGLLHAVDAREHDSAHRSTYDQNVAPLAGFAGKRCKWLVRDIAAGEGNDWADVKQRMRDRISARTR